MHLDEENLQRLVDGELAGPAETLARKHIEECSACREHLEAAGKEQMAMLSLLETLDRPVPQFDSAAVLLRTPRRESHRGRWAAAILVAFVLSGAAFLYDAELRREDFREFPRRELRLSLGLARAAWQRVFPPAGGTLPGSGAGR